MILNKTYFLANQKEGKKYSTAWRQDKHKLSDSGEICNNDRHRQEPGDYISQNKTYASLDRQYGAMWATFSAQTV
jgi:hypothetical protein